MAGIEVLERSEGFQKLSPELQVTSRNVLSVIVEGLSDPKIRQEFNLGEIREITIYLAALHFSGELGKIASQELALDELNLLATISPNPQP
ncbi:MAG: hypothetical protein A3B38_01055 [Candidatus Levybacteria bacterium RIFCSPLOWO2_01_FULL_36_13]|nr:MAG: hypothetical protein A2684_02295 [Candidatus Levybacteria bacterium RIFCSPHIGHO2_01_FULL_36_15b]OGH35475.1 MAG: hypothetical protein A3B38_01055 [Candidatus Levybacteria bacterium RIFCSPLOWO2_01_FULL_36_13]